MSVMVAYASSYGWTKGIAERIAQGLQESGLNAEARQIANVGDPAACEALIVGSGVYLGCWLKEAREFVRLNQAALRERPVWLFSSGPLGTKATDSQGRDLATEALRVSQRTELEAIQPREHRVFFGGFSRKGLRICDRLVALMPASRAILPEGDFRDWDAIEAWTQRIAAQLRHVGADQPIDGCDRMLPD